MAIGRKSGHVFGPKVDTTFHEYISACSELIKQFKHINLAFQGR